MEARLLSGKESVLRTQCTVTQPACNYERLLMCLAAITCQTCTLRHVVVVRRWRLAHPLVTLRIKAIKVLLGQLC